jgi:predicted enzyme related to lactoylglutathione lyase
MIRIGYVNVFVNDLARAIGFYRDVLGLKLRHGDAEHGYAAFEAGSVSLGLAAVEGEHAALAGRMTGVGLAVDDLEAEHARLVRAGVDFEMPPTRQPWGGFMALLKDPSGNVLYLDEVSAAHGG